MDTFMQIVVNKDAIVIDCVLYQLSLKNRPEFDEVVFIKLLQNVNQMWFLSDKILCHCANHNDF